jgi:8-oxo-dGTP pyrophosphatase MutT (NUDIX family)
MNKRLWSGIADALVPVTELPPSGPQSNLKTSTQLYTHQAAVMVLITDEPLPQLIFTLRAKHLTYHAGEVCFPGGMWEVDDAHLLASALRETFEEIGLPEQRIAVLGALPARPTRSGTIVTPFVARIAADARFIPNSNEIDSLFAVPLAQFKSGLQIRTDIFERNGKHYSIPAYAFQEYEIWGFTAAVTSDLLNLLIAAELL